MTYAPGTVQVVLSMHPSRVQETASWMTRHSLSGSLLREYAEQIKAQGHGKRLVVIDPEDRAEVERLIRLQDKHFNGGGRETVHPDDLRDMQAALRCLLTPPKPEEPKGLGAVVELADGIKAVRTNHPVQPWQHIRGGLPYFDRWSDIAAVRVLSAGVGEAK